MPMIPTKNPAALIGYYLGIVSLIPILGFVLGLPAIICGVIGAIKASSDKQAGGMGHAITAIVLGVVGPLLWVGLHVVKVLVSLVAGPLADRLGRRRLVATGWIVYALVYAGFAFAHGPWQVAALFVVYGAYHGLTEGAEKAMIADRVPSDRRGAAFGAYHLVVGILAVPSSVLFGLVWEMVSPRAAFLAGAALAIAALPLLALVTPPPRAA